MTDVESRIATLKEQLKKPQIVAVKDAIENEIQRLQKKMTGRGKDRKAKTADGKLVGIGAMVFSYDPPQRWTIDGKVEERPPAIYERTIEDVNRIGRVRLTGRWQFQDMNRWYSTREAAHKSMIAAVRLDVKTAVRNVGYAKQKVKDTKIVLETAKAFNPSPAPVKTTTKSATQKAAGKKRAA